MATLEDMKRCQLRIETLDDPAERWSKMLKFTDGSRGFKSWDPYELELVPAWDLNNRLVMVRRDRMRFTPLRIANNWCRASSRWEIGLAGSLPCQTCSQPKFSRG